MPEPTELLEEIRDQLAGLRADLVASTVPDHLKHQPEAHYLTDEQLSERVAWSLRRLQELRRKGGGPHYVRNGQRVLWVTRSVLEWEQTLPVANTSAEG